MWMAKKQGQKCKQSQCKHNVMHKLDQVPTGAVQIQAKGKWE